MQVCNAFLLNDLERRIGIKRYPFHDDGARPHKKKRPDMPIIAITGWGEQPEALAKEAMADLILQKPLELIDLEDHIVKLLEE